MRQSRSAKRTKKLDLVFVIDGTMNGIFESMVGQAVDTAFDLRQANSTVDDNYGVIVYRDPVHCPATDKNEMLQLTMSLEEMEEFLENQKSYGGGDDPEDWVGGLRMALHDIEWRDGKKSIFWVADANAHGKRFSGLDNDPHNDQERLLVELVEEMARRQIYFQAINIKRGNDSGCERTLRQIKAIYESKGGKGFTTQDFEASRPEDVGGGSMRADLETIDDAHFEEWLARHANDFKDVEVSIAEWDQDVLQKFQNTVTATMQRSFSQMMAAMRAEEDDVSD